MGIEFKAILIPRGNGEHYVVLDKTIREKAEIEIGASFTMEIWEDKTERAVEIPTDFQASLSIKESAQSFFMSLAYSHKKAYIDWINDAKKEVTRENRIAKAFVMLGEKKKLK